MTTEAVPDTPLIDPAAFRLSDAQAELATLARRLGEEKFAAMHGHKMKAAIPRPEGLTGQMERPPE